MDHLTMNLFAPGMSLLHRAGLGGLACTLKALERHYKNGLIPKGKLPAPFVGDIPPWEITPDTVTLRFGKPENARDYLKRLFAFAFQVKDGVVFLPGQYRDPPPSLAVRAELQTALVRTFLQGAKKNIGLGPKSPYFVDPEGGGTGIIEIEYQTCSWYVHQQAWKAFVDDKTSMLKPVPKGKIAGSKELNFGSLYPGAIKRHDTFNESELTESIEGLLATVFFLVGSSTAKLSHSGDGVLLVPEIVNLLEFCTDRPMMTPTTVGEVRVAGSADAAFQAEVRLRARRMLLDAELPSCRAIRFSLRTWTKPQKSKVDAVEVRDSVHVMNSVQDVTSLEMFEIALAELPPRVRIKSSTGVVGTGKNKSRITVEDAFWIDSVIRPHFATNLAFGRYWYHGLDLLFRDPKFRKLVQYETKGLQAMATNRRLTDEQEASFIASIHRAVFVARGRIYSDTMGHEAASNGVPANAATMKRWEKYMERLRLGLAGAKTATQMQSVISEALARSGTVKELRDAESLQLVRRFIFGEDWSRVRNLALFAIASYKRPPETKTIPGDTEDRSDNHTNGGTDV